MTMIIFMMVTGASFLFSRSGSRRGTVAEGILDRFMTAAGKKLNCAVADLRIAPADLDYYGWRSLSVLTFRH